MTGPKYQLERSEESKRADDMTEGVGRLGRLQRRVVQGGGDTGHWQAGPWAALGVMVRAEAAGPVRPAQCVRAPIGSPPYSLLYNTETVKMAEDCGLSHTADRIHVKTSSSQ